MIEKFIPEVKDCSIFKETALNTVNPLELLREAVSNCDDANSNKICITIDRNIEGQLIITIEDDGEGMDIEGLHKFFNLGFSCKTINKIGEKGVGTKIFYKSNKIYVETFDGKDVGYIAEMNNPWESLCKNEIPYYEIQKSNKVVKRGTKISIVGYKIDNPEKYYNIDMIKDYTKWFTVCGSFRNVFANNMHIRGLINNIDTVPHISIYDNINNTNEVIVGIHEFEEPNENLFNEESARSIDYARTFGPFNRTTNIGGEYVSVQIYGTISGINAKKKVYGLIDEESYKDRFGLYLCKDFIPFIQMNNILDVEEPYHYHIMVNSQSFKLTSDRNNISNIDDVKIKWVISQAKEILESQIKPIAQREYFSIIRKEEEYYRVLDKKQKTEKNIKKIIKSEDLGISDLNILKRPKNEFETALLFACIISNDRYRFYISDIDGILSYSNKMPTDMICSTIENKNILVEVELKLSNFFRHKHPIDTVDYIICWNVDIEENKLYKLNNNNCIFINDKDEKYIAFEEKKVKIVELKDIIEKIKSCKPEFA